MCTQPVKTVVTVVGRLNCTMRLSGFVVRIRKIITN